MKDFIGEMLGTFVLILFGCSSVAVAVLFNEYNSIFQIGMVWGLAVTLSVFLTRRPSSDMQPLFIGLTVSSIILFVAPITQCGLNPARDFGPRLVAYFAGWGDAALPDSVGGWFWVYILAPIVGASIAAVFFKYVLEPINEKKNHNS